MGEKVGQKLGEKVGEKTGEKVGESLGEIHKLNLCRETKHLSTDADSSTDANGKNHQKRKNSKNI